MIKYRKATPNDIPLLVKSRLSLLRSANHLSEDEDLADLKDRILCYYQASISSGDHIAYLAFESNDFVGTGGVCFYTVLPTFHNPTGRKAYVINMYTIPEYRNKGVAGEILDRLLKDTENAGIEFVSLEATQMGRHLYEAKGFVSMPMEMQLKNNAFSIC